MTAVTVLARRNIPAPSADTSEALPSGITGVALADALTRAWPTDAHFTAYAPVELDGVAVRMALDALDDAEAPPYIMVALVADIDGPGHVATPEWRADIASRLAGAGLAYYETRGGFRALRVLKAPVVVVTRADYEQWRELYLGWLQWLRITHGIDADDSCADVSRLYRLPCVVRDGVAVRAEVHGRLAADYDPLGEGHWLQPRATQSVGTSARMPTDDARLARAHALAARLPPSVEGHGGDECLFRAARELSTVLGRDADAIAAVLTDTFNPRCLPPWDSAKLRREAQRAAENAIGGADAAALAARWAAAAEPFAPPVDAPAMPVFLVTPKGKDVFYFDPRVDGYREAARESLIIALRTSGAEQYVGSTEKMSAQALLERGPTDIVDGVVTDFAVSVPVRYDPAPADQPALRGTLVLGVICPRVTAERDACVAAWLEALAGGEACAGAMREWIAGLGQAHIDRLATAVLLRGPHGTGKTIFANACASLWGADPVELASVVAQFNADMARCPVVLDDECKALGSGTVSTADFRARTGQRTRPYEPKGKERRQLRGCQRFVLTANDSSAFNFSDAIGTGTADAITERVLICEHGEDARAALDALRDERGDVDIPRIARHMAWLQATVALPDRRVRFLGAPPDRAAVRRAVLAEAAKAHDACLDRIRVVLQGGAQTSAVFVEGGALWVRPARLAELLATSAAGFDRWDVTRVRQALAPYYGPRGQVRRNGENVRAQELDARTLCEGLGVDVDEALAVLGRG